MSVICPRCGTENEQSQDYCEQCDFPLAERVVLIKDRYRMTKPYVFSTFRAVYLAEDIQDNNRLYSVREFLPQVISSGDLLLMRGQFENLMSTYRQLDHKNMAGIADYFVEGNYYRVIYEYVNGLDLPKYMASHKILTGRGYPEPLVANWTLQMCDLMEYLHHGQEEPIHLIDFKPEGVVFRQEDESILFIDLGISKILSILGPHYLITEDFQAYRRARGEFESVGWDLYCLGNFMYFLLTGIDLMKAPEDVYVPLDKACPGISDAMVEIVHKALGNDYRSGYTDVRDVKADIMGNVTPKPLRAYSFYGEFVGDKLKAEKIIWPTLNANRARTNCLGISPTPPVHLKWASRMKPSKNYSVIASGEFVYSLSKEGIVYGIEKETGRIDWKSFVSKNMAAPPIAANDTIYFALPSQEIAAMEHGSQEFKWKLALEGSSMTAPTLVDDILFVALYNGTIFAVNASEGEILARYKIEGNIIANPIVLGTTMFITSLNRLIVALDVDSEEVLWQYESDTGFSASPSLIDDNLYVGSHDGAVCAINIDTGQPIWTRNFKGTITQAVRASREMIFFTTRMGKIFALEPNRGNVEWEYDIGAVDYESHLALSRNMVYFVDARKKLVTLDAFNGKVVQRLKMSHPAVSQIILAHKQIYLASSTGHMVCFGRM